MFGNPKIRKLHFNLQTLKKVKKLEEKKKISVEIISWSHKKYIKKWRETITTEATPSNLNSNLIGNAFHI